MKNLIFRELIHFILLRISTPQQEILSLLIKALFVHFTKGKYIQDFREMTKVTEKIRPFSIDQKATEDYWYVPELRINEAQPKLKPNTLPMTQKRKDEKHEDRLATPR